MMIVLIGCFKAQLNIEWIKSFLQQRIELVSENIWRLGTLAN